MILPNKYLTLEESLLGLSGLILQCLGRKRWKIDILWANFQKKYNQKLGNAFPTFTKFVYALDFMYIANMITYNCDGEIYNENLTANNS